MNKSNDNGTVVYRDGNEVIVMVDTHNEIVYLSNQISESALPFFHEAFFWDLPEKSKDQRYEKIILAFNSCGGDVATGFALHDLLISFSRTTKRKIVSFALGKVSSSALIPFMAQEERYMADNARFFCHRPCLIDIHPLFMGLMDMPTLNRLYRQVAGELLPIDRQLIQFFQKKIPSLSKTKINSLFGKSTSLILKPRALQLGFITSPDNPFETRRRMHPEKKTSRKKKRC